MQLGIGWLERGHIHSRGKVLGTCLQVLYDSLLSLKTQMRIVLDRFTKQVNTTVFSLFAVLGTMVVMVSWLLVICITLVTNRLFAIQSVLRSLFILA